MTGQDESPPPGEPRHFASIQQEIMNGPPRSVAIICGCLIDDQLKLLVQSHVRDGSQCNKKAYKLIFSDGSAFLPASVANAWAHCFGYYGDRTYRNIRRMQRIRNKFAHNATDEAAGGAELTFDSKVVVDLLRDVDFLDYALGGAEPRMMCRTNSMKYINTALSMAGSLEAARMSWRPIHPNSDLA